MEDNPYRAPVFSEPPTAPASTLSEAEIRAFVGKKAYYYLNKWPWSLDYIGRAKGFNWAAFLLSGFWLPHRKMYRTTFIFYSIMVGMTVVEEIVFAALSVSESAATVYDRVTGLIIPIVCGIFGNGWYLAHAKREIAQIRGLGLKDDDYYAALARRGGTNFFAAIGFLLLFAVVMFGIYLVAANVIGSSDVN
jgi:Protein of unknown function (DUF2628)